MTIAELIKIIDKDEDIIIAKDNKSDWYEHRIQGYEYKGKAKTIDPRTLELKNKIKTIYADGWEWEDPHTDYLLIMLED